MTRASLSNTPYSLNHGKIQEVQRTFLFFATHRGMSLVVLGPKMQQSTSTCMTMSITDGVVISSAKRVAEGGGMKVDP